MVPAHLWRVPAFLEYVQRPLTDKAVAAAEKKLGVKLPASYLACLRVQNGGYLRKPLGISRIIRGIGPKFPSITHTFPWWHPTRCEEGEWAPKNPTLLIPFDGDGHWDHCFDYRRVGPDGEPTIQLVDGESEREKRIAKSFDGYLAKIDAILDSCDDEPKVRIGGDVTAEGVARSIAKLLKRPAPTVDVFAEGYPVWRIALAKGAWCWVTPNRVPAGFSRDGDKVRVTKKTALRFPDEPEGVVLIESTDGSVERSPVLISLLD